MSIALFFAAVAPSLWIVNYFRNGDRFPEPSGVIAVTFLWSIVIALPVLGIVFLFKAIFVPPGDELVFAFYRAFFYAAIPEEFFKFLVLFFYCLSHDHFDEPMDGLVYGVTASLGFAALENVLYVANGGWSLAVTRAVTSVPLHGLNGALMGYCISLYSFSKGRKALWLCLALAIPTLLHGAWNASIYASPHLGSRVLLVLPLVLAVQYFGVRLAWLRFSKRQDYDRGHRL